MKKILLFLFAIGLASIAFCDVPTPTPPIVSTIDTAIHQVIVPAIQTVVPVVTGTPIPSSSTTIWGWVSVILGLLVGHKLIPSKLASITYYLKLACTWLKTILGWVLEIVEALDATNLGTDPKFSKWGNIFKKTEDIANKVKSVEEKVEPLIDIVDAAAKGSNVVNMVPQAGGPGVAATSKNPRL